MAVTFFPKTPLARALLAVGTLLLLVSLRIISQDLVQTSPPADSLPKLRQRWAAAVADHCPLRDATFILSNSDLELLSEAFLSYLGQSQFHLSEPDTIIRLSTTARDSLPRNASEQNLSLRIEGTAFKLSLLGEKILKRKAPASQNVVSVSVEATFTMDYRDHWLQLQIQNARVGGKLIDEHELQEFARGVTSGLSQSLNSWSKSFPGEISLHAERNILLFEFKRDCGASANGGKL